MIGSYTISYLFIIIVLVRSCFDMDFAFLFSVAAIKFNIKCLFCSSITIRCLSKSELNVGSM